MTAYHLVSPPYDWVVCPVCEKLTPSDAIGLCGETRVFVCEDCWRPAKAQNLDAQDSYWGA